MKILAYALFILNSFALVRLATLFGVLVDNLSNLQYDLFRENILLMFLYGLATLILPMISYRICFRLSNKEMNTIKNRKFASEFVDSSDDFDMVNYTQNLDTYYSGQLLNRYNMVNILSIFIFTTISIINIDIRLFIIAFVSSVLPLIVPILTQNTLKTRSENFVDSSNTYVRFVEDKLRGKKELIRYDGVDWSRSLHKNKSQIQEDKREAFRSFSVLNEVLSEGISSISQIIILFAGGVFVFNSIISIGDVITLLQLMNYLAGPVVAMISLYNNYLSSLVAKEKLIDSTVGLEYKKEDTKTFELARPTFAVELENINFSYGERKVFQNLNYRFERDKSYLIRGKSGSGKSTLLKLISKELEPDSGQVKLFGENIKNLDKSQVYALISYVSQKTHIFENSVEDNILLGKDIQRSRLDDLIKSLELDLSVDDLLNKDANISGGEAVRIATARSLIDPNDIIILDEHSSGLNEDLALRITKDILKLNKTVICVSHTQSDEMIDLFDECINLSDI